MAKLLEEFYKILNEEPIETKTNLTVGEGDAIGLEYANMIADAILAYKNLLSKVNGVIGREELVENLKHHIEEDGVEYDKAIDALNKKDQEKAREYKKEINDENVENDNEVINLDDELTKEEIKEMGKEKSIEEKNEVTEEDTSAEMSLVDKMKRFTDMDIKGGE